MTTLFDVGTPRKAANLSVNSDLLAKAREAGLNLSAVLETALVEVLRAKRREAWLADNASALEAYNAQVERRGVFSDGLRSF
jgi:antitoxin CcdA